jgi:hypothetical protein
MHEFTGVSRLSRVVPTQNEGAGVQMSSFGGEVLSLIRRHRHNLRPEQQLSHTLSTWSQEIVAMWRFTRNNGIT